jgi:hypothetical protein
MCLHRDELTPTSLRTAKKKIFTSEQQLIFSNLKRYIAVDSHADFIPRCIILVAHVTPDFSQ